MNPTVAFNEHLLKSRGVRLLPKTCLAINFIKQSLSNSSTPSSLSVTSEQVTTEHCDQLSQRSDHRNANSANGYSIQDTSLDRESFSSTINTTSENRDCICHEPVNCAKLFNDFIRENSPHPCFTSSNTLSKLDLLGFVYPSTLFLGGPTEVLKQISALWSRRLLKAPVGYSIRFLGHTSVLEVRTISQTHFTPLAEALYRCIEELNSLQLDATFEGVVHQLHTEFPSMELPADDILKSSLNNLLAEDKVAFDHQRQVYATARNLHTPWDEFENLTLSDHYKPEREEDDIELEYKNVHSENENRCANFEPLFYRKSKTLSTEDSSSIDCKENLYLDRAKLLRRNSSLSNEIDKVSLEHKQGNFKRSKSFKINYKPSSNENSQLNKNCTCNEIIIKRQSLLSKLWKFGHPNGHSKTRSVSSSSSTSSVKYAHFGSQFPEEGEKCAIIPYDESYARRQVELHSKSTQTVKCGPEDIITLIMKQVGRHALARNRPSHRGALERTHQPETCCPSRSHRCATCDTASPYLMRHKGGSRKSRHKYYSVGEIGESLRCQCGPQAMFPHHLVPTHHQQPLRHRHRKLRSSSTRQYRPNEWLMNYEGIASRNMLCKPLRRGTKLVDGVHSDDDEPRDEHFFGYGHKHLDRFQMKEKVLTNDVNYQTPMNSQWKSGPNSSQHYEQANKPTLFAVPSCGSVLINNSVNLKIEIETSKRASIVPNDSMPETNSPSSNGIKFVHLPGESVNIAPKTECKSTQFANDIYSELTFDQHTRKLSQVNMSSSGFRKNGGQLTGIQNANIPYNPEINYANSITALKEQIARAKANFFNAPLSPSTR